MTYAIAPNATQGSRISAMKVGGRAIEASKTYKVAGWAPVAEEARMAGGEPIWDVVARHLRHAKTVAARPPYQPQLIGIDADPGLTPA
jgi:sulfur-oxidizing protein SoxB